MENRQTGLPLKKYSRWQTCKLPDWALLKNLRRRRYACVEERSFLTWGTYQCTLFSQPFAFQSREFLRNLLIGKEVLYTVSYTTTTNSRDFGSVVVQHSINGETNINRVIVKEGWAKVRGDTKKDRVNEELEVLMALEEEAKTNKKGIWQDNAQVCLRGVFAHCGTLCVRFCVGSDRVML